MDNWKTKIYWGIAIAIAICPEPNLAQIQVDQTGQVTTISERNPEREIEKKVANREHKYEVLTNIFYEKNDDYRLLCDLYIPEGNGPFPCVLAIHGGAWKHGDKVQMLRHAWKLASHGFVVVSISYRHAPKYQFPAQVHDCKQAVRWIRSRTKKLKIDPDKIAVFGYSAGGHLAAMLGSTDPDDGFEGAATDEFKGFSTRVQCVVVGGGPCDFSWIRSNSIKDWIGASPDEAPDLYRKAAPITYVSDDDPPFLFVHGGGDSIVPPVSSKKMFDRLLEYNVTAEYKTIGKKGHFATFSDLSWMNDAIEFMEQHLGRKSK